MNRVSITGILAAALMLCSGCVTSPQTDSFDPNAPALGQALADSSDKTRIHTRSQGTVSLFQAAIEGEQICGFVGAPALNDRRCFARSDIESVSVTRWKDDAGTTAMIYGVMAGCVVLLPLCLAKGASGVGQ